MEALVRHVVQTFERFRSREPTILRGKKANMPNQRVEHFIREI